MTASTSLLTFWLVLLLLLLLSCSVESLSIQFRKATSQDVFVARKILFAEAMNPLSVSEETLLVAHNSEEEEENDRVLGFGQIRSLDASYAELASLYVLPSHRGQGIGTAMVQELLQRFDDDDDDDSSTTTTNAQKLCLLTLQPTVSFYEPHGFVVVDNAQDHKDLPKSLQLEIQAGTFVSNILGNELVCMVRPNPPTATTTTIVDDDKP